MIEDILFGITKKLGELFDKVPVYVENLEQGFEYPCFFVLLVNSEQKPLLHTKSMQTLTFDVTYFSNRGNIHLQETLNKLYNEFKVIKLLNNTSIKTMNLNATIQDDALHFIFDVKPIVVKVDNTDKLEKFTTDLTIKL